MKNLLRVIFLLIFGVSVYYIVSVESERYESSSIVLLKDLSKKQSVKLSDILIGAGSSTTQDSKVLELYMRSQEMYDYLNKKFDLDNYYSSDKLDFLQRLYSDTVLPLYRANKNNLLQKYNSDLKVIYDDASGTLELSFAHIDPKIAQEIVVSIINHSEEVINHFAKENSQIALNFIKKQREEKRAKFIESIKKLIDYQNAHHTIDPTLDVQRKITILSDLELEIVKSEVEYATKLKTWNPNGRDMLMLKENIRNLKKSLQRVKQELAGKRKGSELNANVFDFEILKSDMEFSKEVYRQTLINQEEVKIEVAQQSKHLTIVQRATLADDYTYPNKIWDIFTILVVLYFIYFIINSIILIIRNHSD
jgi:capsular polysaccharide transport system permease protein